MQEALDAVEPTAAIHCGTDPGWSQETQRTPGKSSPKHASSLQILTQYGKIFAWRVPWKPSGASVEQLGHQYSTRTVNLGHPEHLKHPEETCKKLNATS